jgi:solute:Na+ symporter, SSS family
MMTIRILVLTAYAIMIVFIGWLGMKRTRNFSDFFLGGGNVGPWMTAFTYGTAYFSAVLFIGFAGKIGWGFGLSALWIAAGNALIGVLGVWWFIGPRVKKMADAYQVATMAEFFEKRYNSRFLKLLTAIVIFIFFIPYSAAVFMGLSYLFTSNFGVSYTVALLFMGGFTAIYLVMGGYKSMAMIDVIFGMIMSVGVLLLLGSVLHAGGGFGEITFKLKMIEPRLTAPIGPPGLWPLFSLIFLTSVAPFAMPQLIQKFYAIRDLRSIRIGMIASTLFALLIGGIGYFTGATSRLFLTPEGTPSAFSFGKPIFDALMPELIANVIPESLSILILLLIISASMSTLAALVLISSSAVTRDIYAGFINPEVSDKRLTFLMRIASALFIVLSVILAYFRPDTIVTILGISWGAIGATFLGPFLWGLFTSFASRRGAIIGAILSLTVCLGLYFGGFSSPEAGTIGMILSLVSVPLLSLVLPDAKLQKQKQVTI